LVSVPKLPEGRNAQEEGVVQAHTVCVSLATLRP